MAKRKADVAPPPEPSRIQPERGVKRVEPLTTKQLGGATPPAKRPPAKPVR